MIPFGECENIFETPIYNYVKYVYNPDSLRNVPIITIGDSFSQQNVLGYQNFLGNVLNTKIYNFHNKYDVSPEETALQLIKFGYITKGSTVIVESVERSCMRRLQNIKFEVTELQAFGNKPEMSYEAIKPSQLSLYDVCSFIRLRLGYDRPYKTLNLSRNLFTHPLYSNKLYFLDALYDSDLDFYHINDTMYFYNAIENLNKLHDFALERGIKLIYLICADKYDVYSEYVINNPFPSNPTLEYFNNIDTTWLINSKRILQQYTGVGIKDIYRVNDTHWSPIASKIIAEYIAKTIISSK